MNKDFQVTDSSKKKLVCIYRRMRNKPTDEDYEYVKERIKEAPTPKNEIGDLLKEADKAYKWNIGWANYGMLGIGVVIVLGSIFIAYSRGSDFLMDNVPNLILPVLATVGYIFSMKNMTKMTYECITNCLRKVRNELEEEEKKERRCTVNISYGFRKGITVQRRHPGSCYL
ncbi:MAG: hypothetical protein LIO65_09460 [Odoribacter sp.]|nr:hypothetical protein [Odoribacter sp.]